MDYINTLLTAELIFNGAVKFVFDESDISLKSIDFNYFINLSYIGVVDQAQEIMVKLKNKNILDLDINGKKSKNLDFYYSKHYFSGCENCSVAIKDYKPNERV